MVQLLPFTNDEHGIPETDMTCRLDLIVFQTPRGKLNAGVRTTSRRLLTFFVIRFIFSLLLKISHSVCSPSSRSQLMRILEHDRM
jgi:hypothetical protein